MEAIVCDFNEAEYKDKFLDIQMQDDRQDKIIDQYFDDIKRLLRRKHTDALSNHDRAEFWKAIRRMRYEFGIHIFSNLAFPPFEKFSSADGKIALQDNSFWKRDTKKELDNIAFINCSFSGETLFDSVRFTGENTFFYETTFLGKSSFDEAKFLSKYVFFSKSKFMEDTSFFATELTEPERLSFRKCLFRKVANFQSLTIQDSCQGNCVSFEEATFESKVELQQLCIEQTTLSFKSTKFHLRAYLPFLDIEGVLSFEEADFLQGFEFQKGTTEKAGVLNFSKAKFHTEKENDFSQVKIPNKKVDFSHTLLIEINFDGSEFKELLLSHAYSYDSSFMNMKLSSGDRAAFRLIKHFHKEIHDDITANEYYAKEMETYANEEGVSWNDRIVLGIGRLFSNHHQSWLLPLIWMFFFGSQISLIKNSGGAIYWITFAISIIMVIGWIYFSKTKIQEKIVYPLGAIGVINIVIVMFAHEPWYFFLNELAVHINPLNTFKMESLYKGVEAPILIFKILIGFAIYHFIISVRKFSGK